MNGRIRARRLLIAMVIAIATVAGPPAVTVRAASPTTPDWRGGIDLYRDDAFTTQASWLWCTAAGVQIMRNLVTGASDHTASAQRRYFAWMRARNRYDLPSSAGVDPQGWTAGLRHFVDDRYRLVASRSFEEAVRSAVTNLRRTGLPVALTVANGGHGWVLTGFEATADPLVTDEFRVTSVRVAGPLFGRQSRNGYDMPPGTELSIARFRRFLTPWHYDPQPMAWDGRYVTIQPLIEEVAVRAPIPGAPRRLMDPLDAIPIPRRLIAIYGEIRPAPSATTTRSTIGVSPVRAG